jgi:hypothetical protein
MTDDLLLKKEALRVDKKDLSVKGERLLVIKKLLLVMKKALLVDKNELLQDRNDALLEQECLSPNEKDLLLRATYDSSRSMVASQDKEVPSSHKNVLSHDRRDS